MTFSILIVEDRYLILQMASSALEGAGYRVLQATNGVDALQIAADQQPQLVLLAEFLPAMNGDEVCRRLKSVPETAHIPVVMIISESKDRDLEQGADNFITTPFEVQTLLDIIRQYDTE